MLKKFDQAKKKTIQELENIIQTADRRGNAGISTQISNTIDKLEHNRFLIAAFGGFSSGKSTFFNALLGEKIFPSFNTPTTAAINYITYNEHPSVKVTYKNKKELEWDRQISDSKKKAKLPATIKAGQSREMQISDLKDISREHEEAVFIRDITLRHPSKHLLPEGVVWVDTPGTDSVIDYHKQVTYGLIDKADAILFFIYGPVPFKNSDWSFLEDIKEIRKTLKSDKFFFLVNAVDSIDDDEEDILNYVRAKLAEMAGIENPQLIPVSSKLALFSRLAEEGKLSPAQERTFKKMLISYTDEPGTLSPTQALEYSNFLALEETLSGYLTSEKGETMLALAADRGLAAVGELKRDIELERWSLTRSVAELDTLINDELLPDLRRKEGGIKDILDRLQNAIASIETDFSDLEAEAMRMVSEHVNREESPSPRTVEALFTRYHYKKQKDLEKRIKETTQNYLSMVSNLFEEFNKSLLNSIEIGSNDSPALNYSSFSEISPADFAQYIETGQDESSGGGDMGIIGALLGGIAAFLIPGGMGLFGGALLGGLGGMAYEGYKDDNSSSSSKERVFDKAAMREKLMDKIRSNIAEIRKDYKNTTKQTAKIIADEISKQTDAAIEKIRAELQRITEKRNEADHDRQKTESVLAEEEKQLLESMNALEKHRSKLQKKL